MKITEQDIKEAVAEAEARGEADGKAEGEAKLLRKIFSVFKRGRLTLSDAAEEAEMSEEEFKKLAASMP